jgi:hypothetical protein
MADPVDPPKKEIHVNDSLSGLARLERDVLDDSVALASLLRQVLVMGGRASSEQLRTWAQRELKGYADAIDELPDYRRIPAKLKADVISGPSQFTGEEISVNDLPEAARGVIKNEIELHWGVAEIWSTVSREPDEHVRLAMQGMTDVARAMTREQRKYNPFIYVRSIYWSVSVSALEGILDQVRTRLTEFVAELRAAWCGPAQAGGGASGRSRVVSWSARRWAGAVSKRVVSRVRTGPGRSRGS